MAIRIGTASWTDKTLIACGRFYPPGVRSAEARLRHYASVFDLVEVDSSYYALPSASNATLWVERTPPHFVFDVKAFRLLTGHGADPKVLPADIRRALGAHTRRIGPDGAPREIGEEIGRRFKEALWPLRAAGKLGAVLLQFPPWVRAGMAGHAQVTQAVEQMDDYPVSIEFRHQSWWLPAQRDATLAFVRNLGASHVVVDGPQGFANSVPAVWAATQPQRATFRLHGRNTRTWAASGQSAASDRFNYDYSEAELASFVDPLRALAAQVDALHVVFNNNQEDQGQRNARTLAALMGLGPS